MTDGTDTLQVEFAATEPRQALYSKGEAMGRVWQDFPAFELDGRLMFLGEIGSTAHGTAGEAIDDYDLMGIVVPPARFTIGLSKWEHWVRSPMEDGLDVVIYSLSKYAHLLLKANPNVMGLLWLRSDHTLFESPAWDRLRRHRDAFASKHAYHSFVGYAHGQLSNVAKNKTNGYMGAKRKELVALYGYDTKFAAHGIRILRMGVEYLRTGTLIVARPDWRELLAIKRGEWSLEEVQTSMQLLFEEARSAREESPLPDEPDRDAVESLIMEIHHEYLDAETAA